MPGVYYLCFLIFAKVSLARFIHQELASQNLSSNDSKLPSKSMENSRQHSRKTRSSALSPLFEVKSDISFAGGGFKAVFSFLPTKECTCEENHICVGQDDNNNFVSRCVVGQQCRENTCKNGGTCVQRDSTTTCHCSPGFLGEDCSKSSDDVPHSLNFKVAPSDRALKKGKSHVEECKVDVPSEEDVQYEWTFNGEKIEAYNSITGFGKHPGGVLQIDNITDKMEGKYSCTATASSGRAKHTFEYRIFENCDVKIFPGPQSQSKRINEDVLLPCHAGSRAKVSWKKDGVYIDYEKNPRFKEVVNNFLHIKDLEISDAGMYRCEAEDDNGCYSYKEGYLTVVNVRPIKDYCGKPVQDDSEIASSRISKGNDAKPNANPWHVTLTSVLESRVMAFCGGTLISQKYILTAATCIKDFEKNFKKPWAPDNVVFLFGTTDCLETDDKTNRTFKSVRVHPDFGDQAQFDSDIALIELDSPVKYTHAVRPICLEPLVYNEAEFTESSGSLSPQEGKVAGCGKIGSWGQFPKHLQEVVLPYVIRDECRESLGQRSNMLTNNMFCAGRNVARTGDACGGDSGGGFVIFREGRWIQAGIVSWGMGKCDSKRYYGVYTDVGKFYHWIDDMSKFSEEEVSYF